MVEMTENLVRLKLTPGLGSVTLWRLLKRFGDSDGIFGASDAELASVEGVSKEKAALVRQAMRVDPRREMERAVKEGINIIPYDDPEYPQVLRHTFDPPVVIYVRGRMEPSDQVAVGIVGTRRSTNYGREQTEYFAGALARNGFTIVSGLARGIDTYAHIGALDAGGRTIGVLGCGFDYMYPEENRDLAIEMAGRGAVITEFPMSTPPARDTFPARNRIIAGMSLGLLVIESPLRSGALITAKQANDIGRQVFAVPGRVGDPASEGCNKLIRDGAVMVTTIDDILEELNPSLPPRPLPERKAKKTARSAAGANEGTSLFTTKEKRPARGSSVAPTAPPKRETPVPTVSEPVEKPSRRLSAVEPDAGASSPVLATLDGEQRRIFDSLDDDWISIDELAVRAGIDVGRVTGTVMLLKLKRMAEEGPGRMYRRKQGGV